MFAPPAIIKTEVFARIPEQFRWSGRTTQWIEVQRHGMATHSFLEGPSFDMEGNLYLVDIPFGRIFRVDRHGSFDVVAEYDGEPNGLKIHRDGTLYVADFRRGIVTVDPATGRVEPYLERAAVEGFKGLNDLFFSREGDLWFTDQGLTGLHDPTGRLFRFSGGQLHRVLDCIPSPNGLVMALDETIIYVAATRANAVWRVPLGPAREAFKVGLFVQLSGGLAGPDGMAMDAAGNLYVCHAGLGTIWVFSPLGEPIYRIVSCAGPMTTNCAFGTTATDRHRLYITESLTGAVLVAELPTQGSAMFSHS